MSVFRNLVLNFKNADDCENFIARYKYYVDTLADTGITTFYICRLTSESILIFATFQSEKIAMEQLEKAKEWRELNRFEIIDQVLLDGNLEQSWNFNK